MPMAVALLAMVACSGSEGAPGTGLAAGPSDEGTKAEFDPANFVDPTLSSNPYHPLKPGTQWVYGGSTEVGSRTVPHGIIVTESPRV